VDGRKVVGQVWSREEIYEGAAVDEAPDLVIELALRDGHSYTLLPSGRAEPGQTWRILSPAEHMGGKGLGMNGSHRQFGLLLLWGPGVRAGVEIAAGMPDIAPTLLHLMGEQVPEHMDGSVLSAALSGSDPVRRIPWSGSTSGPQPTGRDEADAIRRRLERLGYL
jgi:predicted AlkP superfamily phosphohydrolase/phosphomutase